MAASDHRLRFRRSGKYPDGRVQLYVEWRDLWWPLYIARDAVYICLLPTIVLRIATRPTPPAVAAALVFTPEHRRAAERAATAWASLYPIPAWNLATGPGAERLARSWGRHVAAEVLEALSGEPGQTAPDPLDNAMFDVWLNGNWYLSTRCMATEVREAAVAAVLRHDKLLKRNDPNQWHTRKDLAWWE